MPGFYTHYLFGAMTFSKIKDTAIRKNLSSHKSVYTYGLQGPDFFFYFLPSYALHSGNLGSIMHERRTGAFLLHLLKGRNQFSDSEDRAIAEAYILGFLGHYVLDSAAHPYIYDRSDYAFRKCQAYFSRHIELETEIDSELLDYYKHRKPSSFAQHRLLTLTPREDQVISALLSDALQKTYPKKFLQIPVLRMALWTMRAGTRLFYDKKGHKKPLVRSIESRFFNYYPISFMIPTDSPTDFPDATNVLHQTWKNPWAPDQTSKDSFYDIFENAQTEYLCLIQQTGLLFQDDGNTYSTEKLAKWKNLVGNKSYHSGLPCEL